MGEEEEERCPPLEAKQSTNKNFAHVQVVVWVSAEEVGAVVDAVDSAGAEAADTGWE